MVEHIIYLYPFYISTNPVYLSTNISKNHTYPKKMNMLKHVLRKRSDISPLKQFNQNKNDKYTFSTWISGTQMELNF